MHELALCDALLKMVRDISREEALDGVRSITVRVGTLSGVIPHFLTDCWVAVTDGTEYDATSVVAFRIAAGSASAADIILPTMLATAFSSVLGVLLVKLFIPAGKRKEKKKSLAATRLKKAKTQGAGQRP